MVGQAFLLVDSCLSFASAMDISFKDKQECLSYRCPRPGLPSALHNCALCSNFGITFMDSRMTIRPLHFLIPLFIVSLNATLSAQKDSLPRFHFENFAVEQHAHTGATSPEFVVIKNSLWVDKFRHEPSHPALFPETGKTKKSGLLGVLYSLLLPGMGEVYAGRSDRMIYPLITEGALWLGVVGFNAYGTSIQNDARLFAQVHAGVNQAGKNDQFFVDIGNYTDIYQYNDYRMVERNIGVLYDINNPSFFWSWDTDVNRIQYKDQRIKSDKMYNAVSFVIVGLVANRIWSAIETAVFIKDYNKSLASLEYLPSLRSEIMSFDGRIDGIRFRFTQSF